MEDFNTILYRAQLNNLISEIKACDLDKDVDDIVILDTSATLVFKKSASREMLDYIHCIFHKHITLIFDKTKQNYQITFSVVWQDYMI